MPNLPPWLRLLLLSLLLPPTQALAVDKALQPQQLAVVVNDADPLSRYTAAFYMKARGIPARNLVHLNFRRKPALATGAFQQLYRQVRAQLPQGIRALALAWTEPWRVGCMSVTSAFAFGFDRRWCSEHQCATTARSPFFHRPDARPATTDGALMVMALAAGDETQARHLIERGMAADGSRPPGTAWLVSTPDRARNVRAAFYPAIKGRLGQRFDIRIRRTRALRGVRDIMFYFTGLARVPGLDTLGFRPGAVADHLTSSGGQLSFDHQMSALRWLEAGATGSYGTVVEPCNLTGKFPHPGILMETYLDGYTLIQSYWASVQQPGEGIFIGEPLAAPFR